MVVTFFFFDKCPLAIKSAIVRKKLKLDKSRRIGGVAAGVTYF